MFILTIIALPIKAIRALAALWVLFFASFSHMLLALRLTISALFSSFSITRRTIGPFVCVYQVRKPHFFKQT